MKLIRRNRIEKILLPGRMIQKAVGKDGLSSSGKMTMGFAHYSEQSGPMEPHHHAEEIVYILDAKDGWVRKGTAKENLGSKIMIEAGMTLHFPHLEWHVFEYKKGGFVDIIFFYGQVEKIRPEEIDN